MEIQALAKQISVARKQAGITQAELADRCNLDIRTIQRIESGAVTPRFYTLRIISDALGIPINRDSADKEEQAEISKYRKIFNRRKKYRMVTAALALFLMIAVTLLAFPSWRLFGLPKHVWAPYFYLLLFAHIIGIVMIWRCPACNGLLGDVLNTRYCSKCGLKFYN